ncbi:MAG: trypsin-like peptidase domain-containing protein [Clostridia bacterium]|nr:trypsin-like peptidase domain-containing protein [Clostridia bacterium]
MKRNTSGVAPHSFRVSAALLAALLLLAILSLSLSSCGLLPVFPAEEGDETSAAVTTAVRTPATTQNITVNQYYTPAPPPGEAGTYAYVAEVASPSVVSIITEATSYDKYYGTYVESGAGSGVIFYADGTYAYIITNNHVVEGCTGVKVHTHDSAVYDAEVLGTDWMTDIAVCRIRATGLTVATVGNSSELRLGQEVAAIGNPLGTLGGTVTDGIIGCLARSISVEGVPMTLIQHSAGVSPGNSGGGLFNLYGQLIGIVNAKSAGTGVEDIGFAIPIDLALDRAVQIVNRGYVAGTPYLGLAFSQTSEYGPVVAEYFYNAELSALNQDTIAVGDILQTLGGVTVTETADLRAVLSSVEIGDTLAAELLRPVRYGIGYRYVKYTVNLKVHEYVPEGVTPAEPTDPENTGDINFN